MRLQIIVVPYIGTWIETLLSLVIGVSSLVVPYIGTWIETIDDTDIAYKITFCRTLYRYVDWNYCKHSLNPLIAGRTLYRYVDWNLDGSKDIIQKERRTLYRYVDWNPEIKDKHPDRDVVPYIGTWIETEKKEEKNIGDESYLI